jgi:hypothetical protein
VAVEIGLLASLVLSTDPSPTWAFVTPATVPVKVGLAMGAFRSKADCVAPLTGLLASDVLSQLPSPTWAFVTPATVPVKVGLAMGALRFSALCCAVLTGFAGVRWCCPLTQARRGPSSLQLTVPVKVGLAMGAFDASTPSM